MANNYPAISFWHPAKLLGTWFGTGLSPKASGTMGSIAALPFAYVIQIYGGNRALLIASLIAFVVGWLASNTYLHYTDAKDPKEIVIDEVAGQWLLLSFMFPTLHSYIVGLALFRLFDILKPWPISVADRKITNGFGVMFDDILAAVYPVMLLLIAMTIGDAAGHPLNLVPMWQFLAESHVY